MATMVAAQGSARAAEPARHASTPAERQARGEEAARNFMQGRYEEALATFLDLYIQSDGRPEYLRNIGRCQQKLKQYAHAIESFKDYLRRARRLGADERKEVQGFISDIEAEMEATGRRRDAGDGHADGGDQSGAAGESSDNGCGACGHRVGAKTRARAVSADLSTSAAHGEPTLALAGAATADAAT